MARTLSLTVCHTGSDMSASGHALARDNTSQSNGARLTQTFKRRVW